MAGDLAVHLLPIFKYPILNERVFLFACFVVFLYNYNIQIDTDYNR